MRLTTLLLLWGLLTGCAGVSRFVPSDPLEVNADQSLANPQQTLLIIYNHGSRQEFSRDYCFPDSWTTPAVIRALAGQQIKALSVRVFALCSNAGIGNYNHHARSGEPKVMKRVRKIEQTVREFQALGVPPEQIFLAGHSAGAWASLLVMRREAVKVSGVIALAPAFAGRKAIRSSGWQALREQQIDYLKQAEAMPALIYGVVDDPYESAQELGFFEAIPGVQLQRLSNADECASRDPHRLVFAACFARDHGAEIARFIGQRLP